MRVKNNNYNKGSETRKQEMQNAKEFKRMQTF